MDSCSDESNSDISDQYSFSSRSTTPTSEEEMADEPEAAEIASAGAATAGKELAGSGKRRTRVPGVVYLSRVPPFMKPYKLKHLLSPYGSVGRIYLQPEGMFKNSTISVLSLMVHINRCTPKVFHNLIYFV